MGSPPRPPPPRAPPTSTTMGNSRPLALWIVSRWTTSPSSSTCDSPSPAASPASAAQLRNAPRPPPPASANARARSTSFSRLAIACGAPAPVAARNSVPCASRTSSAAISCGSYATRRSWRARSVPRAATTASCPGGCSAANRSQRPAAAQNRKRSSSLNPKNDECSPPYRAGPSAASSAARRQISASATSRGAEQQGHVAPARRARRLALRRRASGGRHARAAVLHEPARRIRSVHLEQQRREGASFVAAGGVGLARLGAILAAEKHRDPRPLGRRTVRLDPLVPRLATLALVVVEHGGEHVVDPPDRSRRGAEVLADGGDHAGAIRLAVHQPLHLVVEGDVGAPEAVDGLLGIADHEELARLEDHVAPVGGQRLAFAEQEDDLGLQRIGVLELVDQQVPEALLQAQIVF